MYSSLLNPDLCLTQLVHLRLHPQRTSSIGSLHKALPGLKLTTVDNDSDKPDQSIERVSLDSLYPNEKFNAFKDTIKDVQIASLEPENPKYPIKPPPFAEDTSAIEAVDIEWPDLSRWLRPRSDGSLSTFSTADSIDSLESTFSVPEPETYQTNHCLQPVKSGHTLWVGNLSQGTTLEDLCSLFGTPHLQSIYLIQRTGCAFVNYSSDGSLKEAIKIFENRGGTINGHTLVIKHQVAENTELTSTSITEGSKNRYFICKSLTIDDLELARARNEWSTQIRNMNAFNKAYDSSGNVYFVFSVNRTSCFYGIAKLEEKFTQPVEKSKVEPENHENIYFVTPTLEFKHPQDGIQVCSGQTVYDSLRGSQFWMSSDCPVEVPSAEKFTAPARISWLSIPNSTVAFSRTKHLRNCLNQNKPIKVARDGTEIDPEVGHELIEMFETFD